MTISDILDVFQEYLVFRKTVNMCFLWLDQVGCVLEFHLEHVVYGWFNMVLYIFILKLK